MKKILLLTLMLFMLTLTACSHHKKGHDHNRKALSCSSEYSSCSKSKGKECPYLKKMREGESCGINKNDCNCKK